MVNKIIVILFLITSLLSCENNDGFERDIQDSNYPTTIYKMAPDLLSKKSDDLHRNFKYLSTSLNRFGFTSIMPDINAERPPVKENLTEAQAITIAKGFISENKEITGVKNSSDLSFGKGNFSTAPVDGSTIWSWRTLNQTIDAVEVMDSSLVVHVFNGEIRWCNGNWYPEVYIPKVFNFNPDRAKSGLKNKAVTHYTIAGEPWEVVIKQNHLDESDVRLVVQPIKTEEKVELRVAWLVNLKLPVYYEIYIDVMTGAIIGENPTIIS